MLFSSLSFLFVFLPITLAFYYLSPKSWRNNVLLFLSLLFFAWGGVSYSLLFIASIILNFLFAKQINKGGNRKKQWLYAGIIFNILLLISFKYLNFFIENITAVANLWLDNQIFIAQLKIILPLGISFYSFHQMSMLWDTYRRTDKLALKLNENALYVAFFPQLIAGPIVRYKDIIDQIKYRKESLTLFTSGIERFIIGLSKKVIIANTAAAVADDIFSFNPEELETSVVWLGTIAYTLQIYFDFSGYSDMAIGLAKMFGFNLLENFNLPYTAKSIQEFWRKWHISLSTWFRDYVYIPMGGNQKGISRTYLNLFVIFLLTGFWHGATWSFIFWGLFHGFFMILERLGLSTLLKKFGLVGWLYTMIVVMIGWIFFRVESFSIALDFSIHLFGNNQNEQLNIWYFLNNENIVILLIGSLLSVHFFLNETNTFALHVKNMIQKFTLIRQSVLLLLFLFCIALLNANSYNPFIYFKF